MSCNTVTEIQLWGIYKNQKCTTSKALNWYLSHINDQSLHISLLYCSFSSFLISLWFHIYDDVFCLRVIRNSQSLSTLSQSETLASIATDMVLRLIFVRTDDSYVTSHTAVKHWAPFESIQSIWHFKWKHLSTSKVFPGSDTSYYLLLSH